MGLVMLKLRFPIICGPLAGDEDAQWFATAIQSVLSVHSMVKICKSTG